MEPPDACIRAFQYQHLTSNANSKGRRRFEFAYIEAVLHYIRIKHFRILFDYILKEKCDIVYYAGLHNGLNNKKQKSDKGVEKHDYGKRIGTDV
jgi:hypothetical protein